MTSLYILLEWKASKAAQPEFKENTENTASDN